jgi:uncharacterized protein YqfA (UPF0365 family)
MPAADPLQTAKLVIGMATLVASLVFLVSFMMLFGPWLRAFLLGTPVPLVVLVAMKLRGTPLHVVTEAYSTLKRRGEVQKISEVELFYLDHRSKVTIAEDLVELFRSDRNRGG